jgi:hypothetical protein
MSETEGPHNNWGYGITWDYEGVEVRTDLTEDIVLNTWTSGYASQGVPMVHRVGCHTLSPELLAAPENRIVTVETFTAMFAAEKAGRLANGHPAFWLHKHCATSHTEAEGSPVSIKNHITVQVTICATCKMTVTPSGSCGCEW